MTDTQSRGKQVVRLVKAESSTQDKSLSLSIEWHNKSDHSVYVINNGSVISSRDGILQHVDLKVEGRELFIDLSHLDRSREFVCWDGGAVVSETIEIPAGEVGMLHFRLEFPLLLSPTASPNRNAITLPMNPSRTTVRIGYGTKPMDQFLLQGLHPDGDFSRNITSSWQTTIVMSGPIKTQ